MLNNTTENYFWAARNAISERAYLDAMEAMKQIPKKGNALHEYLLKVGGGWQVYPLAEKGICLYNILSTNAVEQVFGLKEILKARAQLPVSLILGLLEWHFGQFCDLYQKSQKQRWLTHAAQKHIDSISQCFLANKFGSWGMVQTNPIDQVYTIKSHANGGMKRAVLHEIVQLVQGTCTCGRWQQLKLLCEHAYYVVRTIYGPKWMSEMPTNVRCVVIDDVWTWKKWKTLYEGKLLNLFKVRL